MTTMQPPPLPGDPPLPAVIPPPNRGDDDDDSAPALSPPPLPVVPPDPAPPSTALQAPEPSMSGGSHAVVGITPPMGATPHQPSDTRASPRVRLERGHTKHKLMREMAIGEKTQRQLGEEYGVGQPAISYFKKRWRHEIEQMRGDIADKFAGLWVAEKASRVAEYQGDVEMLTEHIEAQGQDVGFIPVLTRTKHGAMHKVAEEMGDLPAKTAVAIQTTQINYQLTGIDIDDL